MELDRSFRMTVGIRVGNTEVLVELIIISLFFEKERNDFRLENSY